MLGRLDIAVAGAGPAGLATALYLHRLGHRVQMFERFEHPRPLGSGLILQPTGQAVLADLGVLGEIATLGAPLDRLVGHDARSGRLVLLVSYDRLKGGLRGLGLHRAALFGVLHRAVLAEGIPLETGRQVLARSGRYLKTNQGRFGPFDLLVDALGSASPLKAEARHRCRVTALSYGALWATSPWVDAGFDRSSLQQRYVAARIMIGVLPVGRTASAGPDLAAIFWSLRASTYEALKAQGIDSWKREVAALWPEMAPHLAELSGFPDLTLARYAHHTLPVPAGDGIAFVGDSAHSTSPQLGQGANMALLDARALALALDGAASIPQALERYLKLRRFHVRLYQALSYAFTPFYQSDSRLLPVARDLMVAHLARIPPAPQFLAAMVSGRLGGPMRKLGLASPPDLAELAGARYPSISGQT